MPYKNKICTSCQAEFIPNTGTQTFCKEEACQKSKVADHWRRADQKDKQKRSRTLTCPLCSSEFTTSDSKKKYCGSEACEKERCRIKNRQTEIKRAPDRKIHLFEKYHKNVELHRERKRNWYRLRNSHRPYPTSHSTVKISFDQVKSYIESFNYRLTSESYSNTHQKLSVICPNDHEWEVTYHSFKDAGARCIQCYLKNPKSKPEQEVADYISSRYVGEIKRNYRGIPKMELDIFLPGKSLAIEYCGLYWHSEKTGKGRNYHRNKYEACLARGIRLITIFEDEYLERPNIVRSKLDSALGVVERKVYARKCVVLPVSAEAAREFFDSHHIQGSAQQPLCWGLYFQGELVMAMSFSPLTRNYGRYPSDLVIELKRMASKSGCSVVGGASKLFSFAKSVIKESGITKIVSYSDLRWANSNNSVYEKLGFKKIAETKSSPHYTKGQKRYYNQGLRKTAEERLTGKTEWQLRQEQGYSRIWDCGQRTYLYDIE